ncbi:hypothetical protein B0H14DRAFT_2943201, partial [Mycena olivaceomarginata]
MGSLFTHVTFRSMLFLLSPHSLPFARSTLLGSGASQQLSYRLQLRLCWHCISGSRFLIKLPSGFDCSGIWSQPSHIFIVPSPTATAPQFHRRPRHPCFYFRWLLLNTGLTRAPVRLQSQTNQECMHGICFLCFCWLYSYLFLSKKICSGLGNSGRFDFPCGITTNTIIQLSVCPSLTVHAPTVPALTARILRCKLDPTVVRTKPMLHRSQRLATP